MTIDFLKGRWHLSRTVIATHNRNILARMQGHALLTRKNDRRYDQSLHNKETLKVFYTNHCDPVTAQQEYWYVQNNQTISKLFSDDRLFYTLHTKRKFDTIYAHGKHQCAQDVYTALYLMKDSHHFRLIYTVKGPRKDYQIITHYTKMVPE